MPGGNYERPWDRYRLHFCTFLNFRQLEALESSEHTAKPNAQTTVKDYKSQKKKVFSIFCLLSFKTSVNTFNEIKDSQQNSKTEMHSYAAKIIFLMGIFILLSIRNI